MLRALDARDFDDALSLKQLADDTWEVGVHIADVSHYVREGTSIDREAKKRGNSTYLVGEVVPMLPHQLVQPRARTPVQAEQRVRAVGSPAGEGIGAPRLRVQ